jgi:transcriptional regulator with GAF, ATPase, and Fis domain
VERLDGEHSRKRWRENNRTSRHVFPVLLPVLRERREDIPALVTHFVDLFSRRMGNSGNHGCLPVVLVAWQHPRVAEIGGTHGYPFAGRCAPKPTSEEPTRCHDPHSASHSNTSKTLDDSDRALILETLEQTRWLVGGPHGAAAKLGLKRTTLIAIMRRLNISRPIHKEGTDERGIASETIRPEDPHF